AAARVRHVRLRPDGAPGPRFEPRGGIVAGVFGSPSGRHPSILCASQRRSAINPAMSASRRSRSMVSRRLRFLSTLAAGLLVVSACQAAPGGSSAPSGGASACTAGAGTGVQIPDVETGKFNVAMVLIGPHDDGGWSQAHFEGLQ